MDVKYVVIAEYDADDHTTDSVAFYTTSAMYAAMLKETLHRRGTISAQSKLRPTVAYLVDCRIRVVTYAAV